MTDEMFTNLSDAHMKVLADMGILKHIIANKQKDIQVSLLSHFQSVCCCTFFVYGKVAMCKEMQRVRSLHLFRIRKSCNARKKNATCSVSATFSYAEKGAMTAVSL